MYHYHHIIYVETKSEVHISSAPKKIIIIKKIIGSFGARRSFLVSQEREEGDEERADDNAAGEWEGEPCSGHGGG